MIRVTVCHLTTIVTVRRCCCKFAARRIRDQTRRELRRAGFGEPDDEDDEARPILSRPLEARR